MTQTQTRHIFILQAHEMQELNARLLARAQSVEQKHNLMMEQMTQINECLKQKTAENERLQSELNMLKNSIKVGAIFRFTC